MPASYYQAPEGQDLPGKLSYVISRSALIGTATGIIDAKIYSSPKGFLPTLGRLYYFTWPLVGMSTTFVATTYIATNVRQKDDAWNYALGGAAAGSVFGAWRRSAGLGALASVVLALASVLKKQAVDSGYVFFPDVERTHRGLGAKYMDFTVADDIPGNWTTGKN